MTAPLNTEGSNEQRPLTQLDLAEDFPEAVVDGVAEFLGKPRARGWIAPRRSPALSSRRASE